MRALALLMAMLLPAVAVGTHDYIRHCKHNADSTMAESEYTGLLAHVDYFALRTQLKRFDFKPKPGAPDNDYIYEFEARDNRKWNQVLVFDTVADPSMTFDVPDGWRLSEFELQRAIRDDLIRLHNTRNLNEFAITWTWAGGSP